jgi:hypothetical protein
MNLSQAEKVADILQKDSKVFKDLTLKRSTKIKDLTNNPFNLNNLPKKALENVVTELTLRGDKAACEAIFEKI